MSENAGVTGELDRLFALFEIEQRQPGPIPCCVADGFDRFPFEGRQHSKTHEVIGVQVVSECAG